MRALIITFAFAVAVWTSIDGSAGAYQHANPTEMFQSLEQAQKGDIDAQYRLGVMHLHARRNFEEAVKWLGMAAEQGDARAQHELAQVYFFGLGVPKNPDVGTKLSRRAAKQGLPVAEYWVGAAHHFGFGTSQDHAEAMRWFLRAGKSGLPMAQVNVGKLYEQGTGVPLDYAEAGIWYRLASEQSVESGLLNTGLFTDHQDLAQNPSAETYRPEVQQAIARAKKNLGIFYAHGWGIPRDPVQAYMWLDLAGAEGAAGAAQLRNNLAEYMTTAQVTEAQRLARKWKPKS
jgi:TPR repeat protein